MLVLTRKEGDGLLIGDDIKVFVLQRNGNQIQIGIEAPKEIKILRLELLEPEGNIGGSNEKRIT